MQGVQRMIQVTHNLKLFLNVFFFIVCAIIFFSFLRKIPIKHHDR